MIALREKFFNRITADFQVMSTIVLKQLILTREIQEDNRQESIYEEFENNERILDSLEVKMRNEVINTIVLYSPRAGDLRKIMAYYDMTNYMERIGDLLMNVCGFLKKIDLEGPIFAHFRNDLSKLLETAENMTQNAIFAFSCEDNELAQTTIQLDDDVDNLHRKITGELKDYNIGKTLDEQSVTDILGINSISYNIERIGDNATNIAEAAIYLVEGKNVKHGGIDPDILQAGSEGEQKTN